MTSAIKAFLVGACAVLPTLLMVALATQTAHKPSNKEKSPAAVTTSAKTPKSFDWKMLRKYNVKTGEMPDELKALNNEFIKIPGFIVPLEDNAGQITEFLLVPNQMSCIHVPPPPPNFTFYVTTKNEQGVENSWGPVWLTGRLSVGQKTIRSDSYYLTLEAVSVEPYSAEGE